MESENKNAIWHEVLESIKVAVSPPIFSTWLSQTFLHSLTLKENDRYFVEIGCPNTFVRTTIEQRYFGLIQDSLVKAVKKPCDLIFVIAQKPEGANWIPSKEVTPAPLFEESPEDEIFTNKLAYARLRPSFTFNNFAVSSSNQMAWAAAEAVASQPGTAYNPLFLWGGVGVGKTHLMNAVGHTIIKDNPNAKILACTGEDFTNDIIMGIRNKSTQAFREKYRKLTALFVDDIQFIAGKDTVQEEFFHTFNAITSAGGQVILTSDRPPSEISKLEERLRSRFEAGLIVDIAPPDFELRCAIVEIKAKEKNLDLTNELIQIIASNLESARKIQGYLVKLSSEVQLKRIPLTEENIKGLLGRGLDENFVKRKNLTSDKVIDTVATHFSIGKRALMGQARSRMIARPRQILMYLLRTELGLPLEEVGRLVGGRDHSTVIHAVEKITELATMDVHTREDLLGIKNSL